MNKFLFLIILAFFLPFILFFTINELSKIFYCNKRYLSFFFSFIIFLLYLYFHNKLIFDIPLYYSFSWVSLFNLSYSLYFDYFSLLMCLLVSFIGMLVFFYSIFYFNRNIKLNNYYNFLFLFLGSILALFLSNNLFQIFIFWEFTTISSFFLIGFTFSNIDSIYGAKKSMYITCGFGIFMFIGFLFIYHLFNTYDLVFISQNKDIITYFWNKNIHLFIFILLSFGFLSKSAQGPFYIWLPSAMVAPTPISSFLHSATMVKVGIFLIYKLFPIYSVFKFWRYFFLFFGFSMAIISGIFSLYEFDLKGILAYSTISQLSYLLIIYGFFTTLSSSLCLCEIIYHIFNHAIFKSCLFLIVGIIIYYFKSRDIRDYGYLISENIILFFLFFISSMSMAGLPPFGGFYSKELFYNLSINFGFLYGTIWKFIIPFFCFLSGILTFSYSFRLLYETFFSKFNFNFSTLLKKKYYFNYECFNNLFFSLPCFLLCICILYLGINFKLLLKFIMFFTLKELFIYNDLYFISSHVINYMVFSINVELLLTFFTIIFGFLLYLYKKRFILYFTFINNLLVYLSPNFIYNHILSNFNFFFKKTSLAIQNGNLLFYIYCYLSPLILCLFFSEIINTNSIIIFINTLYYSFISIFSLKYYLFLISIFLILVFFLIENKNIILLVISSSLGILVTLFFVYLQAPDLAMTQICTETITTIFFIIIFSKLKIRTIHQENKQVYFNRFFIFSIFILFSLFLFNIHLLNPFELNSNYFISNHLLMCHGKNIVNLIVVNFRGYDTLGEVLVLTIATIFIYNISKNNK